MLPGNDVHIYSYILLALLNVTVNVSASNEAISLFFFCSIIPPPPTPMPSPQWIPLPLLKRGTFLKMVHVPCSYAITIMSLNFRGTLFASLLIPFTLGFTSTKHLRGQTLPLEQRAPSIDLTEPRQRAAQRAGEQGIFRASADSYVPTQTSRLQS